MPSVSSKKTQRRQPPPLLLRKNEAVVVVVALKTLVLLAVCIVFFVSHYKPLYLLSTLSSSSSSSSSKTSAVEVTTTVFAKTLQESVVSQGHESAKKYLLLQSSQEEEEAKGNVTKQQQQHGQQQKQQQEGQQQLYVSSSSLSFQPVNMSKIQPRAFPIWNKKQNSSSIPSIPCYPPEPPQLWRTDIQRTPAPNGVGLFFMKLMKVGGSTAAGVHIRIAQRLAKKRNNNNNKWWSCQGRWDHALAHRMEYDKRNTSGGGSFLWTMLREPTKRAVSQFFHFKVSRENVTPTDEYMLQDLAMDTQYAHYYLRYLSTKQAKQVNENTGIEIIHSILHDYDFIGITERFDESIVALLMILNLHLSDGLYLDSKTSGSYDDKCIYIQPSFVSSRMQKYFTSPFWQRKVKWDTALYHAANRSLDMTIDALGRVAFQDTLSKFRQLQALGREHCASREVFPCTSQGEVNKHVSCLWIDSGCGSDCLDSI
jgi:hypothetical protein